MPEQTKTRCDADCSIPDKIQKLETAVALIGNNLDHTSTRVEEVDVTIKDLARQFHEFTVSFYQGRVDDITSKKAEKEEKGGSAIPNWVLYMLAVGGGGAGSATLLEKVLQNLLH